MTLSRYFHLDPIQYKFVGKGHMLKLIKGRRQRGKRALDNVIRTVNVYTAGGLWRMTLKYDRTTMLHQLTFYAYAILEMWVNAQRDGHLAEYRWRPLLNAAVWLTPSTRVTCSNGAKTRNPLKLPGVPQTNETISAASGPKFTILWGRVEEILLLNKFFFRLSIHA